MIIQIDQPLANDHLDQPNYFPCLIHQQIYHFPPTKITLSFITFLLLLQILGSRINFADLSRTTCSCLPFANFVNHAFFVKNYLPTVTMEPIFFLKISSRKNDAFVAKIVSTRLTKICMAIFAPDERLPSSATLLLYTYIIWNSNYVQNAFWQSGMIQDGFQKNNSKVDPQMR